MLGVKTESSGLGAVRNTLCEALPEPSHGGAPMHPLQETQEGRAGTAGTGSWRGVRGGAGRRTTELQASSSSGENLDVLTQHDRSVMATHNRKTHRKQILKHAAFLAS